MDAGNCFVSPVVDDDEPMMRDGFVPPVVDDDVLNFFRYGYGLELTMRKNILKMANKLFRPLTEPAAMAAETNDFKDAVLALRRMSGAGAGDGDGDSGALEFQSVVEKLRFNDLRTLDKLLDEQHLKMLISKMGVDNPTSRPEVKAASSSGGGGGDSSVPKYVQGIGAIFAKLVGGAVSRTFDAPPILEPFEKAAGALGLMSVIGGVVLQDKKPGLSRAMVKFGSVAIALGIIVPIAGNIENVIMAWIVGVLAAAIVALTVTNA